MEIINRLNIIPNDLKPDNLMIKLKREELKKDPNDTENQYAIKLI